MSLVSRPPSSSPFATPLIRRTRVTGAVGRHVYLHDLVAARAEYWFKPPAFVTSFLERNLNDVRDMPIAYLFFNVLVTQVPALIALYTLMPASHLLGAAYLVVFNGLYLQRFILAMHYSTHRRLFKPGFFNDLVNKSIVTVLAPIFGIPSNAYGLHHVTMHHVDNNEWNKDLSATEGYQRDNFLHWVVYWVRFMALGWVELPLYAVRKRRWGLFVQCAGGMAASICVTAIAWRVKPIVAGWTAIAQYVLVSAGLMFGNWSQHAFVCPRNPRCNYRLSCTVLNHPDNQRSYNDGFHTLHHINSQIHWSEFPAKFVERLRDHGEKDAIVFDGIGFFDVGVALMLRRHGWLADRFVNVGQKPRTREEVIELLKERLRPVRSSGAGAKKME